MWIRDFLPELTAFAALVLWFWLLVPLILRPFGVSIQITINLWKRKQQKLGLRASMLFGVLGFGVGMIIFGVTLTYVRWKLHGNLSDQPTFASFAGLVLKWAIFGVVFGLFMHLVNGKRSGDQPDPTT